VRERVTRLLRPLHDRIFREHVYEVRGGYLDGYLSRGRMPWFQRRDLGERQAAELAFLEGLDLEGAVVYDVGANRGTHTFFFHRLVGLRGEVHAFEPDPTLVPHLWDLAALNHTPNVEVHAVALGAAPAEGELVVPDGSRIRMSATLSREFAARAVGGLRRRTHKVRVVRLDDYREALSLPPPAFMKIDVEGFELEVLRGARRTLAAALPRLFVELHGLDGAAKQQMMRDVLALLEPLGYRARHVESGVAVTGAADRLPEGGHLFAEAG
jgi:FkbM family methyltransferase